MKTLHSTALTFYCFTDIIRNNFLVAKIFLQRLCFLINIIFLFNSENIRFYPCIVKYESFTFIFSIPLLWTINLAFEFFVVKIPLCFAWDTRFPRQFSSEPYTCTGRTPRNVIMWLVAQWWSNGLDNQMLQVQSQIRFNF